MKHFLLKNSDGGVQVMQLIQQEDGSYSTPDAEIAKWAQHKRDEVKSWRDIKPEHLPKDRSFRNAWCDVTPEPTVDIDMPKARDIHRDRLRAMRAPKLAALDIEMTRAFNDPPRQVVVESKRKGLRDVTTDPAIELAKTPEELTAVIPAALTS